jgi:hypothetical protein
VSEGTVVVESRFQGPPTSGNGGYVCGRLAAFLDGAVAVRLREPPPLEVPLSVQRTDDGAALTYEGRTIAAARPVVLPLEPSAPPTTEQAAQASRSYRGFESHWFPSCFVCGPEREPGDGLRIFPGAVAGADMVACRWTPDATLGDGAGRVRPEFLWAALDCPGGFAFEAPAEGVILLGELAVALDGDVAVGEPCVVVGWETRRDGRKHHTGTAIYDASGACRGVGRAIWLEAARPPT